MIKTLATLTTATLVTAALTAAAHAQQTPNEITAQLNRAQLQGQPLYTATTPDATVMAQPQYPDITVDNSNTSVTVVGPARTTSSFGQPDTSPQSAGTPVVDAPYAAVVPAPDAASVANGNDKANPDTSPFMKPHDQQQ